MNGSSFFSNKITNVPLHQFSENGESSNLKGTENESSKMDQCVMDSLAGGSLEIDGCNTGINVCIDEDKLFSSDLVLNSEDETLKNFESEKLIYPNQTVEDQMKDSMNFSINLKDQVESVKPTSSTDDNGKVESINSTFSSEEHMGLKSSSLDSTSNCAAMKDHLQSVNSSFNLDEVEPITSNQTVRQHMGSNQHLQNEQDSESIDSLLAFEENLVDMCPVTLEKPQTLEDELKSSLFQQDNQSSPENKEKVEQQMFRESGDACVKETYNVASCDSVIRNNENQAELKSNQNLPTEVDISMDPSSSGSDDHEMFPNNDIFEETLDQLSNSCQGLAGEPHNVSDNVNKHMNKDTALKLVVEAEVNMPSNCDETDEICPPVDKALVVNSEDNSSTHNTFESGNQVESVITNNLNEKMNFPEPYKPTNEEPSPQLDSYSNQINECDAKKEIDITGKYYLAKSNQSTNSEDITINSEDGVNAPSSPAIPNIKKEKKEMVMAINAVTESRPIAHADLKEPQVNVKNEFHVKGTEDNVINGLPCKKEKKLSKLGDFSPYTKFGLKHCRVYLGSSRINDSMLKNEDDPLESKPNFNKLKRKLEIMLQCAEKEEEKAIIQLKKMRVEKSTVLQDILKEIQKVKKKFKV